MSKGGVDQETEFLSTGVKTYSKADDAMTEFRRLVQQKCRTVVSRRLDDVNRACGMDWTAKKLREYSQKTADHHYVGLHLDVIGLGGLYFCLRISRGDDGKSSDAFVFLYRLHRGLATELWRLSEKPRSVTWKGKNNRGFGKTIPGDKIHSFERYLDQAITAFLDFITKSGGLKKHRAQGA
jgi:hypothetical protein